MTYRVPVLHVKTRHFFMISMKKQFMIRIKNLWLFIFWAALIAAGSCARRGVPTGGPKDTIPPKLINMTPSLETVNFDEDELALEFDEYIEARSLKQDIIINPPVKEYDFYVNRRIVAIELKEDLQENTTYTVNFRDAIKDVSEQNPAENIIIAFSTGSKIDSFEVQGQVKDLFTNKPAEDVLIALYPEGDTLNPFEDPPMYLTKTDEEGRYAIRYIRVGTYKIFAYADKNNNLILDSNTEAFAFQSSPVALIPEEAKVIPLPDSLKAVKRESALLSQKTLYGKTVDLQMLTQDVRPITLQSARTNGKYFEVKTNKALDAYQISTDVSDLKESTIQFLDSLNSDLPRDTIRYLYSNFQDEQKTIRIYNAIRQDSIRAYISMEDSVGHKIQDTLYVKFTDTRREKEKFTQSINAKGDIKNNISAKIKFSKPIIQVNTDSILLSYDTLFYISLDYGSLMEWNESLDQVTISKEINKNQLLDSIVNYAKKRDSIAFIESEKQQNLYLDSLQSTNEWEEKFAYFEVLVKSKSSLIPIRDSLLKVEDEAIKNKFLAELADTLQIDNIFEPKVYERDELMNSLKPLVLYISGGSFTSIENDSSQQVIQRFSFKKPEENGKITGTVTTEFESYTLELLNKNFEVVAETKPTNRKYTFDLVPPGEYYIRILIDANLNGKWDRGNILENTNSEPIYFYTDEEVIELRANWQREINLSF